MLINSAMVDELRELALSQNWSMLSSCQWNGVTVGGALKLACLEKEIILQLGDAPPMLTSILNTLAKNFPIIEHSRNALQYRGIWNVSSSISATTPLWEVMPAPLVSQLSAPGWTQFQMRLTRSLQQNDFGNLSTALVGAMDEMVGNILEHAAIGSTFIPGAVAYRVAPKRMSFAVSDIGQGVLSSLRSNPAHQHLHDGASALYAAIVEMATAKVENTYGDGFQEVNEALIDLNGQLCFRSDDGLLRASGITHGQERHYDRVGNQLPTLGFHLAVHCHLDGAQPHPEFDEF